MNTKLISESEQGAKNKAEELIKRGYKNVIFLHQDSFNRLKQAVKYSENLQISTGKDHYSIVDLQLEENIMQVVTWE